MRDRYRRLRAFGFLPHVAVALAEAGYDVVFVRVEQMLGVAG